MSRTFWSWSGTRTATSGFWAASLAAVLGLVTPTADARADEPARREVIFKVIKAVEGDAPAKEGGEQRSLWIGVQLEPAADLIRAQLKLEYALAIVQVFPDSPAAKAGLKQHDLIVKVGDKVVNGPEDVIKAVRESGEKELTLIVLREAKEQTVKVTPTRAPEGSATGLAVPPEAALADVQTELKHLQALLGQGLGNQGADALRARAGMLFVHPPVAAAVPPSADKLPWPKDLSIQVRKEGDSPARITVRSGDNKWEDLTEDKLDTLPENIRPHVKSMLTGHRQTVTVWEQGPNNVIRAVPVPGVPLAAPAIPVPPTPPLAIEVFGRAAAPSETDKKLDQILERLERLTQDVEALKKK